MANIGIGPWGGEGPFEIVEVGKLAYQIRKIVIYAGDVVDSLQIFYVRDGLDFTSDKFGGDGGGMHEVKLQVGDYIKSMTGAFNTYYGETCITKLEFTTSSGEKYGPFGDGGGTEFTVPVRNGRIVGFFGQYRKFINSIGVYVAAL